MCEPEPTGPKAEPVLSVVVPVYNGAETLRECLEALCDQTLAREKYEVLVVDDGSTDETPQIIADFPVRCVRLEPNAGRLIARQTGAREASCDDIFFCDSRVICEPTVLETVAAHPRRPLMYGSDFPQEYFRTLYGRFLFCVYRKLWKPYFPQDGYAEEIVLTEDNFDKVPKGTTVFATDREFFLRHQPEHSDRHVSDDTLLFASMVREKPIVRYRGMKCHYRQRTDLRRILPHLHFRGVLFHSFYLRPGHRFFWYYFGMLAVLLAAIGVGASEPTLAWVAPALVGAAWLVSAVVLGGNVRNSLAVLVVLPLVGTCFWSGILRGHLVGLRRWIRRGKR